MRYQMMEVCSLVPRLQAEIETGFENEALPETETGLVHLSSFGMD